MNKKLTACIGMAAAACLALLTPADLSAQGKPDKKPAGPMMQVPIVGVAKVQTVQESNARKYPARLSSVRDVNMPARVSGKIEFTIKKCEKCNYLFQEDMKPCPKCGLKYQDADTMEGEFVKQGDLLIKLEDTTYVAAKMAAEAQLAQATATVKQATVNRDYCKRELDRQNMLRSGNATTEQSYEAAQKDYALAQSVLAVGEAAKASAEAALLTAQTNLSYTRITADFNGKLGKITYSPGNYVSPSSSSLCEIVQFDPIYVVFSISEQDYLTNFGSSDALQQDGVVRIRIADAKKSIYNKTAPVWIVDNKIDNTTGTIKLWAKMDNKEMHLTPGGVVEAILSKRSPKSFPAVPISAVQTGRMGRYVWVLADDGSNIVHQQVITTGDTIGGLMVVLDGLKEGQTVVSEGAHKIIQIPGVPAMVKPIMKPAPAGK